MAESPAKRLRAAMDVLSGHYGPPDPPPTRDPFELILLENVAYLAKDERRRAAFELLRRTVGTRPGDILAATDARLRKVTAHGILGETFAEKLRTCARVAMEEVGGDVGAALRGSPREARRALRRFPGIGEPGAEKILLLSGREGCLAPDSNALRVLVRTGIVADAGSYARTYAAARDVALEVDADVPGWVAAHLHLQRLGRETCKNTKPRCAVCPLRRACAFARAEKT